MRRSGLSVTLLVVFAVQLLGAMTFASVCLEPCPDDAEDASCPPVCALCTSCTHAQTGILRPAESALPLMAAFRLVARHPLPPSSHLPDDIFHVPLIG